MLTWERWGTSLDHAESLQMWVDQILNALLIIKFWWLSAGIYVMCSGCCELIVFIFSSGQNKIDAYVSLLPEEN